MYVNICIYECTYLYLGDYWATQISTAFPLYAVHPYMLYTVQFCTHEVVCVQGKADQHYK